MLRIMFNDKCRLTDAVIKGCKSRTTRFEKLPDKYRHYLNMKHIGAIPFLVNVYDHRDGLFHIRQVCPLDKESTEVATFSPRYKIGERYAVAQPYKELPEQVRQWLGIENTDAGYTNKMFVKPKWMPYLIRITDIEILPLAIYAGSEQLCLQEGIVKAPDVFPDNMRYSHVTGYENAKYFSSYGDAFESLLDEVCGRKGTYKNNRNTWVVSYSFEVEQNIIL